MQTIAHTATWTDEELLALPRDGQKYEVLSGEVLVSPTGFQHGYISSRLLAALLDHALRHRLGVVVDWSTGFRMKNGDCLSPDVSFVRKERLRGRKQATAKFFNGGPDLVVEVMSPGESRRGLKRKLIEHFANGTRLAWVVDPKETAVFVYSSPAEYHPLSGADLLDGEMLLPGFTFPVRDLFELPDFSS